EDTINKIAEKDELRARDVLSFFIDFYDVAKEVNRVMKENSKICLVVGNRTVKGITIPTDEIMAEIFEDFNYSHKETLVRSIPSKRMPKRNSPTNVKGETLSTMNEESIVILKR
ncbi:DNA methyltransferase, partial [Candidatus Woesearchaeota archaeon CG_4_10_14_0_8_um_filter_47_5]